MLRKIDLRKTMRNLLYYGIPILLVLSTAIHPIRPLLMQALVAFCLVWFIAGYWLMDSLQ